MEFKFKIEYKKFLISAGFPEGFADYFSETTAGCSTFNDRTNKWYMLLNLKTIKRFCNVFNRNFEEIVTKTISHETMHIWLTDNFDKKTSDSWDNISGELEDYGIF